MSFMPDQPLSEDNPLSLELKSLRASVARFQDEAHASAVKLQRHSLDNVHVHEHAIQLERENDLLRAELAVLRANSHTSAPSEAQTQVQELTLSLRRLSHKLSLTEESLLAKTTELIHVHAEAIKAKANADNAYELGARVRGREEAGKVRERGLERRVVQLEEDLKMADVVMKEYAALVRGMEAKSSFSESGHSNGDAKIDAPQTLAATLAENKLSQERLLHQFQTDSEKLHVQLEDVTSRLDKTTAQLEAEIFGNEVVRTELGRTRTELEKLQLEDGTAAKMVSRYMQFSQTSTNKLLSTLSTLKARHEGTLSTLSSQNFALSTQLRSSKVQNERLRSALDELGGEILKESYGRRREVALRIKMGGREDRIVEGLRRWVRRGDEALARLRALEATSTNTYTTEFDTLLGMVQDARILLDSLEEGALDEATALALSGARARAFLVGNGLDELLDELREENDRRITLEKQVASIHFEEVLSNGAGVAPHNVEQEVGELDGHTDEPPKVPEKLPPKDIPLPLPPTTTILPVIHEGILKVDRELEGHSEQVLPEVQGEGLFDSSSSPLASEAIVLEIDDQSSSSFELPESTPTHSDLASSPKIDPYPVPPPLEDVPSDNLQLLETPPTVDEPGISLSPVLLFETEDDEQVAPENTVIVVEGALEAPSSPIPLETTVSPPPSEGYPSQPPHSISFPSTPRVVSPERNTLPHPLLADLALISKRYDDLQRAFRDCHLALEGLKVSLTSSEIHTSAPIPVDILDAALGRLDDYNEDARVELEIRISDEALLAKGYEALLCVPGAMASSIREGDDDDDDDEPIQSEVEKQIEEFVSGTDQAVRKARETFARKLDDVQHDIASLKRAIHDPDSLFPPSASASLSPTFPTTTPSASTSTLNLVPPSKSDTTNGSGWTSWIRGSPSHPSSPALPNTGPAPTFGNIMTSPRLRPSPSAGSFQSPSQSRSRRSSFFGLGLSGPPSSDPPKDPLAQLGLKVPMPNFGMSPHGHGSPGLSAGPFGGYGMLSPTSPLTPIGIGMAPTTTRARTVSSSMYMLGLGAASSAASGRMSRSTSSSGVSVNGISSPLGMSRQVSQSSDYSSHGMDMEKGAESRGFGKNGSVDDETDMTDDDGDTDVE